MNMDQVLSTIKAHESKNTIAPDWSYGTGQYRAMREQETAADTRPPAS